MTDRPPRDHLLLVAYLLSGAAALGYEIVWSWLLGLGLGSEVLGTYGVLAGFFGGSALGAWMLDRRAVRAKRPARMFAVLEVGAAAYAAVSPYLLSWLSRVVPPLVGRAAGDNDSPAALSIAILVSALALLPGTFCIGGTLAALAEARRRSQPGTERLGIGRLYAANTLGATVGIAVAVHVIVPAVGLAIGTLVLAALGLAAAALAWRWDAASDAPTASVPAPTRAGPAPAELFVLALGLGLAGIGLESVGVPALSQVFDTTVYTFADVLAVYLLGTAVGAWLYAVWARRRGVAASHDEVTVALLVALVASLVLAAWAIRAAPEVVAAIAPGGAGWGRTLLAEPAAALLAFALPTALMGALFSHVVAGLDGVGVGRAVALDSLGAALAPIAYGVTAVPAFGLSGALTAVALTLGVLAVGWVVGRRVQSARARLAVAAAIVLAAFALPGSLDVVAMREGWRELWRSEGLLGTVVVSERVDARVDAEEPFRMLQVDQQFRMGGAGGYGERRMGHLSAMYRPFARSVLFLGVGSGGTLGAVARYPVERIEAVELVPAVIEALPWFEYMNGGVARDPRVHLHAADARRYVAASRERFDLIVADLIHPGRQGAASLYSVEHFENVRARLRDDGLFVQWLPLYQLPPDQLRVVIRTFLAAFPRAHALLGSYSAQMPVMALLGRRAEAPPLTVPFASLSEMRVPESAEFLMGPADIYAAYLADRDALEAFAGEGPVHTDLRPVLQFAVPRQSHALGEDLGRLAIEALAPLQERPLPEDLVPDAPPGLEAAVERLKTAAHLYLVADVRAAERGGELDDEGLETLERAYETDPTFLPTQGYLFRVARARPDRATEIYGRMAARTPDNVRVFQEHLAHLERSGDEPGFQVLRERLRQRFGPSSAP